MLENTSIYRVDHIMWSRPHFLSAEKICNIHPSFQSVVGMKEKKRKLDLHAYGVLQWNWHIPAKEFEMMIIIMVMYLLGSLLLAMQSLPFRLPMSIHTNVLFKCRSVRQILCIPNTYLWALLVNYRVYHYQNCNFRAIRLNALLAVTPCSIPVK